MDLKRNIVLNIDSIKNNFIKLFNNKYYVLCVSLTAFFSYGYEIFHGSIGTDDTSLNLYFVEGLAPQIGRNTLYIINKLFNISEFSPVITDFLGVLFMIIAATLLCAVFLECSKNTLEIWMCTVFTCTMISFSLISEVFIYYLHNGIGIGYLLTVFALIVLWGDKWNHIIRILISGVCLTFAITCYESFALVFLLGFFLLQWFTLTDKAEKKNNFWEYILNFSIMLPPAIIALLGRRSLTKIIDKAPLENFSPRSLSTGLWILEDNLFQNIKEIIEDVIIYYGINSIVICSLMFFNFILLLFIIIVIVKSIKNRKMSFFLNGVGLIIVPWLFLIIEGKVTQYRQMQAMNVLEGFMLMVLCYEMCKDKKSWEHIGKGVLICFSVIVIYNQSYEQNHFYYVDYLKYEEDKNRIENIMLELCRNYDETKPLCFVTEEDAKVSGIVEQYYYYDKDSQEYIKMNRWAKNFGIELECDENGYCPVQTLANEVSVWASGAWGGNVEMKNFYAMHGYKILLGTKEMLEEAKEISNNMNSWPENNSIKDMGSYIVIKL